MKRFIFEEGKKHLILNTKFKITQRKKTKGGKKGNKNITRKKKNKIKKYIMKN